MSFFRKTHSSYPPDSNNVTVGLITPIKKSIFTNPYVIISIAVVVLIVCLVVGLLVYRHAYTKQAPELPPTELRTVSDGKHPITSPKSSGTKAALTGSSKTTSLNSTSSSPRNTPAADGTNTGKTDTTGTSGSTATGYPNASNTGVPAGTALTVVNGDLVIDTDGAVVSGKDVRGCVAIRANNVTFKNSRVSAAGQSCNQVMVYTDWGDYSNITIQNVEIDGGNIEGNDGVGGSNFTAIALNIHNVGDGVRTGDNVVFRDSFVHDLHDCPDCHNDGVQTTGSNNVVISHNTLYNQNTQTSAIMIGADLSSVSSFTVDNNLMAGGGYTIYGGADGPYSSTSIKVTNNKFSTVLYPNVGYYGAQSACIPTGTGGSIWSGNIYYETGGPLNCG